jgi:hypothetical protein
MRNHRRLAAPGALILGVAATACAALPTSGSVQLRALQGSGGQPVQQGVVIVPAPPRPGWSPIDIVNGFLAASASFVKHNHAVARDYLTPRFNRRWRPGWAATIIDSPGVAIARTRQGAPQQSSGKPSALVDLTGLHFAQLQTAGQDQAGSVVVSPGPSKYLFSLVQKSGGWRIDAIYHNNKQVQPTLLLLASADFAREYLPRNLYFYGSGSASNALVPDPVYIPQTGLESEVRGLVNALIHPPPPSSWLSHAASTAFPSGTKLIKPPQVIGGIKAVVTIGGKAARADAAQQQRMADQLALSLTKSPYATQYPSPIRTVVLQIGNHPLKPLPGRYAKLVPRGVTSPLYYQVSGVGEPAVSALPASSPTPVPLPLPGGLGNQPFTAMAVSTAPPGPPVIAGCLGRNLYLIKLTAAVQEAKKLSGAKLATVTKRLPATCTSLSWDDRGNLWVTAESHTLVLPAAGTVALAEVSLVGVQVLPWLQYPAITSLRVAPDGVRVAMIVGTGVAKRILVAAISRNASVTYVGQTQQTLRVGSDIANPVALAWLDPDHLLALSRSDTGRTQMFEVPLNGGESTEVAIPRGVTSVTANWPGGQAQPHVVIGIAPPTPTSPGSIEISKSGMLNPDWQPLAKGATPVFPG